MMTIIKKFFVALWGIFKRNVRENKDAIRDQIRKDIVDAAAEARN